MDETDFMLHTKNLNGDLVLTSAVDYAYDNVEFTVEETSTELKYYEKIKQLVQVDLDSGKNESNHFLVLLDLLKQKVAKTIPVLQQKIRVSEAKILKLKAKSDDLSQKHVNTLKTLAIHEQEVKQYKTYIFN